LAWSFEERVVCDPGVVESIEPSCVDGFVVSEEANVVSPEYSVVGVIVVAPSMVVSVARVVDPVYSVVEVSVVA
jgi:hypothetical protein